MLLQYLNIILIFRITILKCSGLRITNTLYYHVNENIYLPEISPDLYILFISSPMHCDIIEIDFEQALVSIVTLLFSISTTQCRTQDLSIPFSSQHFTADTMGFDHLFLVSTIGRVANSFGIRVNLVI